jgi:hypothetical protein
MHTDPVSVTTALFRQGYEIFYPVSAALSHGVAVVVGHIPTQGLPNRLRRPGARIGRKIETWIIEDAVGEVLRRELSGEERALPIAVIWNHALLAQRVHEGWRPEHEGVD